MDSPKRNALHTSPGPEDVWQLHFSELSGHEYTVPGMFIANQVDNRPATVALARAGRALA